MNKVASMLINPFTPRPAKTGHFVILLCLMPDKFTCQGETLSGKGLLTGSVHFSSLTFSQLYGPRGSLLCKIIGALDGIKSQREGGNGLGEKG